MRRRSSTDHRFHRHAVGSITPVRPELAFVVAVCAAAMLFSSAVLAATTEDVSIAGLRVTGNLRTPESAILNTFGLESGRVYPYPEIRDGLDRIYAMGFFDDVRLYSEDTPAGRNLTIEVTERPVVTAIRTAGHTKVDKDDIRSKIAIAVGSSLDPRLVQESIAAIKALYKEKGYYLANVTSEVETEKPGAVAVTFRIEEGLKSKVGEIKIVGNNSIGAGQIKKVMETKKGLLSRVPLLRRWTKKDFNPEKVDTDSEKIVRLYREQGFINAKVVSKDVSIDRERGLADITITVDEGQRFYLRKADLQLAETEPAEGAVTREALVDDIQLEPGRPYGVGQVEGSLQAMYSTLGDQGFVYAEIEPVESFEGDSANVTFNVKPGPAVHVARIVIEGNDVTFDKVIRREMLIKPGDILRRSVVERSHRDIFNLGYFEDVQINSHVVNEKGDVDLIFNVKEKQTGIFNVGAGYSEEFGLTGFVEFSHNNVGWFRKPPYLGLGKGETMNLRWEFGKLSQIELGYRNPWFRDRPVLVGADLYNTKYEYDTYDDKRAGFGLVAGRRFPLIDYSNVYVRYTLERRELVPDPAKASDYVKSQAGSRTTSSSTITFLRNSVDNPFFPRYGSRTTLSAEWAGGFLGGSTAYQLYIADNSSYLAVPLLNSCLVFRARVGLLDELGDHGFLPVDERFRLGGATTDGVRGYDDREIVPEGNAIDVGGRFMMLGTLEYRVPVIKNQAFVRGFLDAGNTWNSARAASPGMLKRSAGVGFMIEIPMVGQIGLDFGYAFDRSAAFGGPGWKTHFQFGMSGL